MKKIDFKKSVSYLTLVFLLLGLMMGCGRTIQYNEEGWRVSANAKKGVIIIKQDDLGIILKDIHLNIKKDGKISLLSGWSVIKSNGALTIKTNNPENTLWEFKAKKEALDITCSIINGVITGIALASKGRIPARVAPQDNGVIYTSIGFVSAQNIYSLFDRITDIMIQFPKESELTRNASNEELMDVSFSLVDGAEISLILNYYTDELGLAKYEPYYPQYEDRHPFRRAPTGWLSWYCYYMPANEEDMINETDALEKSLKSYGLEYIQLDATYSRGTEANLLEWDKEKFPKGGKWLMQYIKSKGLRPGLWVNVYGANYPHPAFADKYPDDWFLHDKDGNLISACCTADSTVVKLDFSNPEVIEKHLKPLFKTYVEDWGIEYLKDAGHGEWMFTYEESRERTKKPPVKSGKIVRGRHRGVVFNPSADSREIYWKVQEVVREIMGPKNWVMGCDAEGGADKYCLGFGIFDSAFNIRHDVYAVWFERMRGAKMYLASMFCANYLNDIVLYNDPDATMVRPPLTMDEAMNNVTSIALTGQSYMTSDFMSDPSEERAQWLRTHTRWGREYPNLIKKLPDERVELYKKTMPTTDITPIDLFPYRSEAGYAPLIEGFPEIDNFPKALDLKVSAASGVYDVVAIYNWLDDSDTKIITFGEDLGLDPYIEYVIFDFWNQKFLGIFKDKIQTDVAPHGVRVFVIRPLTEMPQLLAASRHITGAYSIKALDWDTSNFTLSGTSLAVPGTLYSLFFYVPKGITVAKVNATAEKLSHKLNSNGLLKVSFMGQKDPIHWEIKFIM